MPERFRERRRYRERTVYLYAAGVLLLLAVILGGVGGWLQRSGAAGSKAEYAKALETLRGQDQEMARNAERNAQVRERLNRILREVEISSFQAALAEFLRGELRSEIRLTRLQLQQEPSKDDTEIRYRLVLEGQADDSDRRGLSFIEELRAKLAAEAPVQSVAIEDSRQEGNAYQFRLSVVPAFQSYQG